MTGNIWRTWLIALLVALLAPAVGCDDESDGDGDADSDGDTDGDGDSDGDSDADGDPVLSESDQSECLGTEDGMVVGDTGQSECVEPSTGELSVGPTTQTACLEGGDPYITDTVMGECLDDPAIGPTLMEPCDPTAEGLPDEVEAVPGPGRFTVIHRNATHNCCGLVAMNLSVDGTVITVREEEVFDEDHPGCWCVCEYTLSAEVTGLAGGTYTVRVIDDASGVAYTDDVEVVVPAPESTFTATGGPGQIALTHLAAEHNCCATVTMAFEVDGTHITVREAEEGAPCDCNCMFDLAATIRDLPAGEYTVEIAGGSASVEGVVVTEPEERIAVRAEEDALMVEHLSASWNCCGEVEMLVTLDEDAGVINVEEVETYPDGEPCRCTCAFDLGVTAEGFPAGDYTVRVFTMDGDLEQLFGEAPVHIPGSPGPIDHVEQVVAESAGDNAVLVSHVAATYNCCSEIVMEATFDGGTIEVVERIVNDELCYCVCQFDLDVELSNLAPGDYTVDVTAADGRGVGSDVVTVTGDGPVYPPEESVNLELDASTLTVTHHGAELNCCAEIEMTLEVDDSVLILEEVVSNPEESCDCMCYFDLTAVIDDLEAGAEYTLQLWDYGRTTQIHQESFTAE